MPIYLDHAATTPLRPEALAAMLPYLGERFGNPSSAHAYGRFARAALDEARERVAAALGATAREIVFTSGGTEANNLAVKGAAWAGKARGHRIVVSSVEHHSVGHAAAHLAKFGFEVIELPVDRYGRVDPDEVEAVVGDRTTLVSVMLANNEVGTIEPVAEIARRVHAHRGVLVHVDAVQAAPYLELDVAALDADLLTISAHKFEGPKGVGALYIRRGTHLLAQQHGGTQERYRRGGTENVAAAVGMAEALDLARAERAETTDRLRRLRDRLTAALTRLDGVESTGHPTDRLPGLASVIVHQAEGDDLALALDLEDVAVSTGSACTSGSGDVSHVLTAMGYPAEEARGAVRLSLGRTTTEAEVDHAIEVAARIIAVQRAGAEAATTDAIATDVVGGHRAGV